MRLTMRGLLHGAYVGLTGDTTRTAATRRALAMCDLETDCDRDCTNCECCCGRGRE